MVKLLEDAIRDGDNIYATVSNPSPVIIYGSVFTVLQILGTGINQCGSAAPIGAPVAAAQQIAMERAYAQSGRSPLDVDFVELHATGESNSASP